MANDTPSSSSTPSSKIVLAHTDASFREKTKYGLEYAGHTVLEAAEGEEAMRIIQESKPDLIFLDLVLPRIDGVKLMQKLRKQVSWVREVPLLVVIDDRTREEDIDGIVMVSPDVQFVKHDWALGHIVAKTGEMLKKAQGVRQK